MSRYNLYTTKPLCHNTFCMSRHTLHVAIGAQGPASSGAAGIRTPSHRECHHRRLLLFFGRFFVARRRKAKPETTAFSQEKKTWPGGEEGGIWGEIGGNLGPPGHPGVPPPRPDPFSAVFLPNLGVWGGGREAGGAPRPIVGHRVVTPVGAVRFGGVGFNWGAAELQFWGDLERFWGKEENVIITCCLRRGSGRAATSWKAIATPPRPKTAPKNAHFRQRQKPAFPYAGVGG